MNNSQIPGIFLRKGSKGIHVKKIQKDLIELGFKPGKIDGYFGEKTRAAVKEFQARQFVTGVISPLTARALVHTRVSKKAFKKIPSIKWVASPNFSTRKNEGISMIVIRNSTSGSLAQATHQFENPSSDASVHYIIDRTGKIIQMVKDADKAWHSDTGIWMDKEHCNLFSIGIELVGWGQLKKKNNVYTCWPENYGKKYTGSRPVSFQGKYWEPYGKKQLDSLISLCHKLMKEYHIESANIAAHGEVVTRNRKDPGPQFNWKTFREALI